MGNIWKGSTKIILKDVNTGKEIITEDENIFKANTIADSLRSMGYYNCDPFYNSSSYNEFSKYMAQNAIWKSLIGGIMLFDSTIPETAINMPAEVKMIGNGSYGRYNNGTPNELGSWNDVESSVSDGEITLVYDYTTQQANGTIKCVSLTSREGGYAGMGNQSGTKHSSNANLGILMAQKGKQGRISKNGNCIYKYFPSESYQHLKIYNSIINGAITVTRIPIYIESIDLCADPYNDGLSSNFDISIPTDSPYYTNYYSTSWCCEYDDNKIGLVYTKTTELNHNDPFYLIEVDLDNRTSSNIKEFHSPIDGNIKLLYYSSSYSPAQVFYYVGNNRFFIQHRTSSSQLSSFDLYYYDANTDSLQLVPNTKVYNTSGDAFKPIELSDNLFLLHIITSSSASDLSLKHGIYDAINGTFVPYNGSIDNYWEYSKQRNAFIPSLMSASSNGWLSDSYRLFHNPFYLATINNLESPVTKTSNQTMKVIYTLTRQQS